MNHEHKKDKFLQGYLAALADLVRFHKIGAPAEELLYFLGIKTVKELRQIGCSQQEIDKLKSSLKLVRAKYRIKGGVKK